MANKDNEITLNKELKKIAEKEPQFSIISDHPLEDQSINLEDFNLNYHIGPIYDILRSPYTKPPMAIAIYGDWGTGKTTAMKWLDVMLRHWNYYKPKKGEFKGKKITVKPVWFYPWKYDNKEDVWRGLIAEIILESIKVEGADIGTITKATKQFGLFLGKSFLHALSAVSLEIPGIKAKGSDIASAIRDIVDEFKKVDHPENAYLNEFESALQNWIKDTVKGDKRLVIFVDDLDRCMPEVALRVLEALKLYLNIDKLVFVVGVDREIIDKLVEHHYTEQGFHKDNDKHKFSTYLAKIFQLEVHLLPTVPQMKDFLNKCLNEENMPVWNDYLEKKHQEIFKELIEYRGGRTPREIKRNINSSMREGIGAVKVATDGNEKLACAQGMQLYFIREEFRQHKIILTMLGDGGSGDDFFRNWSRIVTHNCGKVPLNLSIVETHISEKLRLDKGGYGSYPLVGATEIEKGEDHEESKEKKVHPAYQEIVNNSAFKNYLHLLDNKRLGLLMQIPYPEEDSPLLRNAAIVTRKVEAETTDEQIIMERIASQLRKSVNELTEKEITNIKSLNLSDTRIKDYSLIEKFTNLTSIYLSNNQLAQIPPEIEKLTNLTILDLSNNQLTEIPPQIEKLTNLMLLELSNNQLTQVPHEIVKLTNLTRLYLHNNQLTQVPPQINKLIHLKELALPKKFKNDEHVKILKEKRVEIYFK